MPQQAPSNPSLPQNDTPAEQAARAAQLATARQSYVWTTTVPSLPGVPLSAKVPPADSPTLTWWLDLVRIGVAIARNQIAVKQAAIEQGLAGFDPIALAADAAVCDMIEADMAKTLAKLAQSHPTTATGFIADLEALGGVLVEEVAVAALKDHAERLREIVSLADAERTAFDGGDVRTLDDYRSIFATLPLPPIGWTFMDDSEFARLRVAGPNAGMIRAVSALPANFPVTSAQYADVVPNDTLAAALAEGRLFLCDYAPLATIEPGTWRGTAKFIACPMALFARPPGAASLVPVAIQCDQNPATNPVFTPSLAADRQWGWEVAKFLVQVADGNYHELFAHLAHTHLVTEAVAVATHRQLASQHPVWALLVPHFEGTLFINEAAATSLITPGGPIDHIFAGTIGSSQATAAGARMSFDFAGRMLPADMAARGVGDAEVLPDYPYRDDGMLVWQAIRSWVSEYLGLYYTADSDVAGDTELAAWAQEVAGEGGVGGFAAPQTVSQLIDCCTMIVFTASAQHAAVNFPQATVMEFAPAVTGAAWQDVPLQRTGTDKAGWLDYLPPRSLALEQLAVLNLLGSLHYRPLGTYLSCDFPYPAWFTDPAVTGSEGPLARFQAGLAQVEAQIVAANANRRVPYPFLQPSLVPTSTNI